jgi:hypothetical protein
MTLILSSLIFAGGGFAFFIRPEAMMELVGIHFEQASAATAASDVRAVYGGLQLGLACVMALAAARRSTLVVGVVVQVVVFSGLVLGRITSRIIDGDPGATGLYLFTADAVALVFGVTALLFLSGLRDVRDASRSGVWLLGEPTRRIERSP